MNLIRKQGFINSLILYAGTALGFFNLIILFQRFLSIEEIGFFSLMIAISLLYAQISSMGIGNVILKYFPYHQNSNKQYNGFITLIMIWSIGGFAVFTFLFFLFKYPIVDFYSRKQGASLLVKYFYYLVPLSFLMMVYAVLESMALTVFRNVLSSFLREVVLRLFTLASVLLIAISVISYQNFLLIYIGANAIVVTILLINISRSKHFKIAPISSDLLKEKRTFLSYGFFTVLSGSSFVLIQNLDMIMLSLLTKESLRFVGIYGTFFSIAMIISLPAKALGRTSLQIVAQSWAVNDLQKIGKIYYKTSVVQMLIGCLLFIGLVINKQFIVFLLHKPAYASYYNAFIIIGLAFLVDMTGGLNNYIMNISRYYRTTTLYIVLGVIFCLLSNWLLIPLLGMSGAAISYFLTIFVLNFAYFLFVKLKFGLQPFGIMHLWILLISIGCLLIGLYLPAIKNQYLDMIYRSVIVSAIYVGLAYILRISEDISSVLDTLLKRLGRSK